jgi:membrane protease YdiL (CAAX protease family)
MLGYHALMIVAVLTRGRPDLERADYRAHRWRLLILGALPGLAGGTLFYLIWPHLGIPVNIDSYIRGLCLSPDSFPWFAVYFVAVNPVVEEYYWRGWLGSDRRRPVWNDFIFSGYHPLVLAGVVEPGWLAAIFVILAVGAWLWRLLNQYHGGLLASTLSHLAGDLSVMTAAYFLISA